jgi:hypothetical protein
MICLNFHGLLFVGRTNRQNSIPQKTESVISRRRQLACKRRHYSRIQEWTGGEWSGEVLTAIAPVTCRPAFRTLSESPRSIQVESSSTEPSACNYHVLASTLSKAFAIKEVGSVAVIGLLQRPLRDPLKHVSVCRDLFPLIDFANTLEKIKTLLPRNRPT